MENTIDVKNVTMRFIMEQERTDTLKEYMVKLVRRKLKYTGFTALKDVSFSVRPGDSLALIGQNGSGKSTMLKLIAGVMEPTKGSVTVRGSIAPLIELSAGFDPDLTGRENIFLNGALLGYRRKFMQAIYDEIVDFADLGEFIDVPVRSYSSGMIARLGFSIATHVQSDILVVDEVLAVGDYNFQQKCYRRMEQMLGTGKTLLFVSHDADQVKKLCRRAVWLDHGKLMADGPSGEVCDAYLDWAGKNGAIEQNDSERAEA
ncbi:MAG: ABC transporter ATP-binding protein [Clostridia bacterium]|nr:ABC transporter ATP-binding protein [Clostridia bacterium]